MGKVISSEELSPTLHLSECSDGWWLYDSTRGMNLAMHAKSREAAWLELAGYYQHRLASMETAYRTLRDKVESFVEQFVDEHGDSTLD